MVHNTIADISSVMARMEETPALASVPRKSVRSLVDDGRLRRYQRGSYLFSQDDDSDSLMFLHEGRVEISSLSTTGQRQWLTTIEPPQFFGEVGVLGEVPRSASALAIEDSVVWSISGERFLEFLLDHREATRNFLRVLARQIQAYGALVDDLLFLDLRGRVAKRLVGLVSPSLDQPAPNGTHLPVITQADLASLAGGSREHVSRILSDFQKRGLIERDGRRYVIVNIKGLVRLAGIEP